MISNVTYVTRGSKCFKINYHVYMYVINQKIILAMLLWLCSKIDCQCWKL